MNSKRVLRVANTFLLVCGWQVHWYDPERQQHRVKVLSILYFVVLLTWYGICFNYHFEAPSVLALFQTVSPVLHACMRLHLLMGFKVLLVVVSDARKIARISDAVAELSFKGSLCKDECLVYGTLFASIVLSILVAMYDMYELWQLQLPVGHVMLFFALFLPHFCLASSLKYVSVISVILKSQLQKIRNGLDDFDSALLNQLEAVSNIITDLNRQIQMQLFMLLAMNAIVLLAASYALINVLQGWSILLVGPLGRTFKVSFSSVFLFVLLDYFCLIWTSSALQREKQSLSEKLNSILKKRQFPNKNIKFTLKDMRNVTAAIPPFKILWSFEINLQSLLVINSLTALGIAQFVIFHLFNDRNIFYNKQEG